MLLARSDKPDFFYICPNKMVANCLVMDPIVKTDFSVTLSLVSENVLDNAEGFVLKNVHY